MNVKHPDRIYRNARLNYIVNRMRVREDITPARLAEELHVSERTIYRDLRFLEKDQALKKRYSRREGRYMLETELHLQPLILTPSEALAIYTAASNLAQSGDNFLARDLRSGLAKIGAALAPDAGPASHEERADASLTADSIQRPMMETIRRAVRSNRKIRLRYWSAANGGERELTVTPYDVRFMERGWYLLANSDEHGVRPFKIGRVRGVEILPERFRFPRHFSADDLFARAWETYRDADEDITIQIRFAPSVAALVVESSGRQFSAMERRTDGSLICTCVVHSRGELTWWVLSFGATAEILSPPELRAEFAQIAQAMAALYA
jgi:proteasome accessory factor B